MPRATRREIKKSQQDHAEQATHHGQKRHTREASLGYTSESARARAPMYCRAKADPRDKFWRALGKQVRQGVGVRVNVRG